MTPTPTAPPEHSPFGPFGPASRLNMSVHASGDGGETWPTSRVYWPGAGGYSSVLALADGLPGAPGLGVIFENASFSGILFVVVPYF